MGIKGVLINPFSVVFKENSGLENKENNTQNIGIAARKLSWGSLAVSDDVAKGIIEVRGLLEICLKPYPKPMDHNTFIYGLPNVLTILFALFHLSQIQYF